MQTKTYSNLLSNTAQEDLDERCGTSGWEFDGEEVKDLRNLMTEQKHGQFITPAVYIGKSH